MAVTWRKRIKAFYSLDKKNLTIFQYNSFTKRLKIAQQSFISHILSLGYNLVNQKVEFLGKR